MMTLIYAPPSSGKTLAALAACPNAQVATPKAGAVIGPASLYGLDVTEQVTEVRTFGDLKKFVKVNISDGPVIIDDLTPILERLVNTIKGKNPSWDNFKVYGKLKELVVPFFQQVADDAVHPLIITAWEKAPKEGQDVEGTKEIVPGGVALPGTSIRDTLPGLCQQVLRLEPEEEPTSAWPFQFRTQTTVQWRAKCREPASVPPVLPPALSAIYRAGGYECEPMYEAQVEHRAAAKKALREGDRKAMGALFVGAKQAGINLHCVAYAVSEAQVEVALEDHTENLADTLASSYY